MFKGVTSFPFGKFLSSVLMWKECLAGIGRQYRVINNHSGLFLYSQLFIIMCPPRGVFDVQRPDTEHSNW